MILNIKGIEESLEIIPGSSYELVLENPKIFYDISKYFKFLDSDNISLYDLKVLNLSKYLLVVDNLFDLNPNSKKILTANYKYAEDMSKTTTLMNELIELNNKIMELISEISEMFNNQVDFKNNITISDLLDTYEFKFNFDDSNFIQAFVTYIKAMSLANKYEIIVTFNIQDFLNNGEFLLLVKEFGYLGLTLVNICSKKSNLSYKKTIILDNDLCEI